MRRPAAMRIILPLLLLVAAGCVPAMSKAFIRDEDLASLRPDTSATCIVGAHIYMTGELMGVTMRTADGELTTEGVQALGVLADGFTFVNVPKGPFRVTSIKYRRDTGKVDAPGQSGPLVYGKAVYVESTYSTTPGPLHLGAGGTGPMPNEMSGTCSGGFIWLGEFKGDEGGTFSKPGLKLSHLSTDGQVREALIATKSKLANTPWAAEVDKLGQNQPLAETELMGPAMHGPATATAKPEKPKVEAGLKLIDAGAEPRKQLRYAAAEGTKRALDYSFGMNGMVFSFSLTSTVAKGAAATPRRFDYQVDKSSVENNDSITGFVQFDDRGMNPDGDYQFAPGKAPKIGPPMSVVAGVSSTVVPFPEEPVGVGATWEGNAVISKPTFNTTQKSTYKLEGMEGNVVRISIVQSTKTSFSKPIKMPTGMLVGNEASGTGEAKVNLAQLVPDAYHLTTTTENLLGSADAPQKDPSGTKSKMETKLEGK